MVRSSLPVSPKVVFGSGAMSEIVEAMDIDGKLYVSGQNLPQFLERAMERGAEIERARIVAWLRDNVGTVISDLISIQIEECDHLKEKGK
jgi:hypothetical protein